MSQAEINTESNACDFLQVGDEAFHFRAPGLLIGCAQNGRWMYGCHYDGRERGFQELAAMLGDTKVAAQQGLRRGGAEVDDYFCHRLQALQSFAATCNSLSDALGLMDGSADFGGRFGIGYPLILIRANTYRDACIPKQSSGERILW